MSSIVNSRQFQQRLAAEREIAEREDIFDRVRREVREKQEQEAERRRQFDELTGRKGNDEGKQQNNRG